MLPAANQGVGTNTGFPDVCNTRIAQVTVPLPYPNFGMNASSLPFTPTVFVSLMPGHNQNARPLMTNGDNLGTAHTSYMKSGANNCGIPTVLLEGSPAETLCNSTSGNNSNCTSGAKLVPSLVNVLVSYASEGAAALAELRDRPLGLGALLDPAGVVLQVRRGGAAARLGLRAEDQLLGARLEPGRLSLRVARGRRRLRLVGRVGPGAGPVTGRVHPGGVGQLVVRRCSWGAPAAARRALDRLVAAGARALLLDLRGNPGGDLAVAAALAGLFLPAGSPLCRAGARQVQVGPQAGPCRLPLAVLVDGQTVSAAEVLALALVEHGRARCAGAPTWGKLSARPLLDPAAPAIALSSPTGAPLPRRVEPHVLLRGEALSGALRLAAGLVGARDHGAAP